MKILSHRLSILAIVIAASVSGAALISWNQRSIASGEAAVRAEALSAAFKAVARSSGPSVVHITANRSDATPRGAAPRSLEDLLRPYSPRGRSPFPRGRSTGTGMIIDRDGTILTNNHVIAGASEISIKLRDGRRRTAEIVGRDKLTDLAVLRITDARDSDVFAPIPLGDSDAIEVGDWVVAVGNPFGLQHSVTTGIISAKGRSGVGIAEYENFLQTDAAINPGNSGGPLVNLRGQVVGINTAIASQTGAYAGIGFAIPSNMAKRIVKRLTEDGEVVRGWLGVYIQDLDEDLAGSFNVKTRSGVLVSDFPNGSPARDGGLEAGDIIVEIAGRKTSTSDQLRNFVADLRPGAAVDVTYLRKGKKGTARIEIGERPVARTVESDSPVKLRGKSQRSARLGLSVRQLTRREMTRLQVPGDGGLIVDEVTPGGRADRIGIRSGDAILRINGKTVTDTDEMAESLRAAKDGVRLQIMRDGRRLFLFMRD